MLLFVVVVFVAVTLANTPCNQLFPNSGGLYNEVCMFAGNGMFSSMTFGRANKYYLLNDEDPNDLDLEHYILTPTTPSRNETTVLNFILKLIDFH